MGATIQRDFDKLEKYTNKNVNEVLQRLSAKVLLMARGNLKRKEHTVS